MNGDNLVRQLSLQSSGLTGLGVADSVGENPAGVFDNLVDT